MLAGCKSKWDLKGNLIYSDENGEQLQGKEEQRARSICVEKGSTEKVMDDSGIILDSTNLG